MTSDSSGEPAYAAARHSYRWCKPPTRSRATTLASRPSGRCSTGRPEGVAFPSPRCVRSSWYNARTQYPRSRAPPTRVSMASFVWARARGPRRAATRRPDGAALSCRGRRAPRRDAHPRLDVRRANMRDDEAGAAALCPLPCARRAPTAPRRDSDGRALWQSASAQSTAWREQQRNAVAVAEARPSSNEIYFIRRASARGGTSCRRKSSARPSSW